MRAVPVHAQPIGPGLRLTVHVFAGRGRPSPTTSCAADGDQGAYALFGTASRDPMAFTINNSGAPSSVAGAAPQAIRDSFAAWDAAIPGSYFTLSESLSAPRTPGRDGVNIVGWARLVPKSTLAATWTYTDAAGRVIEADILYNTGQRWAVLSRCEGSAYDVANVGTHEVGHVLALDHVSDAGRQATMYPSAPAGEVIKRTLTAGDVAGAQAALE